MKSKTKSRADLATIATADKLPPIFAECCAKESERFRPSFPFARGGFWYATDGQICVRCGGATLDMPVALDECVPSEPQVIGWDARYHKTPLGIPPAPVRKRPCVDCFGGGVRVCTECHAKAKCESCGGVGRLIFEYGVRLCGKGHTYLLDDKYARLLVRHGVNDVFLRVGNFGALKVPFRFFGDGFDGLVMPFKPESKQ